jgi:hypothetical protein
MSSITVPECRLVGCAGPFFLTRARAARQRRVVRNTSRQPNSVITKASRLLFCNRREWWFVIVIVLAGPLLSHAASNRRSLKKHWRACASTLRSPSSVRGIYLSATDRRRFKIAANFLRPLLSNSRRFSDPSFCSCANSFCGDSHSCFSRLYIFSIQTRL